MDSSPHHREHGGRRRVRIIGPVSHHNKKETPMKNVVRSIQSSPGPKQKHHQRFVPDPTEKKTVICHFWKEKILEKKKDLPPFLGKKKHLKKSGEVPAKSHRIENGRPFRKIGTKIDRISVVFNSRDWHLSLTHVKKYFQ